MEPKLINTIMHGQQRIKICHIFVSKLNTADFKIQFNSGFAIRTVIYADILLHKIANMKSLSNFNHHT